MVDSERPRLAAPPARPAARTASFRMWEAALVLVQPLLLSGVLGLARSGATGGGWPGGIGLEVALAGRVAFVPAGVQAVIQGDENTPLLPLGALGTTVGMLLASIATSTPGGRDRGGVAAAVGGAATREEGGSR